MPASPLFHPRTSRIRQKFLTPFAPFISKCTKSWDYRRDFSNDSPPTFLPPVRAQSQEIKLLPSVLSTLSLRLWCNFGRSLFSLNFSRSHEIGNNIYAIRREQLRKGLIRIYFLTENFEQLMKILIGFSFFRDSLLSIGGKRIRIRFLRVSNREKRRTGSYFPAVRHLSGFG